MILKTRLTLPGYKPNKERLLAWCEVVCRWVGRIFSLSFRLPIVGLERGLAVGRAVQADDSPGWHFSASSLLNSNRPIIYLTKAPPTQNLVEERFEALEWGENSDSR